MASLELIRKLRVRLPHKGWPQKIRAYILQLSRKSFKGIDIHDLDVYGLAVPITAVYVLATVICFCVVWWALINFRLGKSFVSLKKHRVTADCEEVPLSISNTFEGSIDGYWTGSPNFKMHNSLFILEFNDGRITNAQYRAIMEKFKKDLEDLGKVMKGRSASCSAMAYSTFYQKGSNGLEFWTNFDAGDYFDRVVTYAFLSSKEGVCVGSHVGGAATPKHQFIANSSYISGEFDYANRLIKVKVPNPPNSWYYQNIMTNFPEIASHISCPAQLNVDRHIEYVTWMANYREGFLQFDFDIRSIFMAAAFNLGYQKPSVYDKIDSLQNFGLIGFHDGGVEPAQGVVWCIDQNTTNGIKYWQLTPEQAKGPPVCFVQTNKDMQTHQLYYPVIFERYVGLKVDKFGVRRSELCECDRERIVNERSYSCERAQRMPVALIYTNIIIGEGDDDAKRLGDENSKDDIIVDLGLKLQSFLVKNNVTGDLDLIRHVWPIVSYSLAAQQAPPTADEPLESFTDKTGVFQNMSWANGSSWNGLLKKAWGEICSDCAAVVFEVRADESTIPRINKNLLTFRDIANASGYSDYNEIESAMCEDFFSLPHVLDKLIATPPVPLVEKYFSCSNKLFIIMYETFGSAIATTNTIMVTTWILAGMLFAVVIHHLILDSPLRELPTARNKAAIESAFDELKNEALVDLLSEMMTMLERSSPRTPESDIQLDYMRGRFERVKKLFLVFREDNVVDGLDTAMQGKGQAQLELVEMRSSLVEKALRQRGDEGQRGSQSSSASFAGERPLAMDNFSVPPQNNPMLERRVSFSQPVIGPRASLSQPVMEPRVSFSLGVQQTRASFSQAVLEPSSASHEGLTEKFSALIAQRDRVIHAAQRRESLGRGSFVGGLGKVGLDDDSGVVKGRSDQPNITFRTREHYDEFLADVAPTEPRVPRSPQPQSRPADRDLGEVTQQIAAIIRDQFSALAVATAVPSAVAFPADPPSPLEQTNRNRQGGPQIPERLVQEAQMVYEMVNYSGNSQYPHCIEIPEKLLTSLSVAQLLPLLQAAGIDMTGCQSRDAYVDRLRTRCPLKSAVVASRLMRIYRDIASKPELYDGFIQSHAKQELVRLARLQMQADIESYNFRDPILQGDIARFG